MLLHLNALECALPLFFCYNRPSDARWGSLYYEDCLKLSTKFPEIYKEFQRGSFVVNFKKACACVVPIDQGLEKAYKKPAKGQGDIIAFTRRTETVAQCNLIRHEKAKISSFLRLICHLTMQDEYTFYNVFSDPITKRDSENGKEAVDYIRTNTILL